MAEQGYPFENIDTTESQFSKWARNFQQYGVKGIPGDTNLKPTGDDSGLQVRVSAGQAFIRGHYYINSLQLTLPIVSAGTNSRIDAVVVELDPDNNVIAAKIVQGVASSGTPVAPTLEQTDSDIYQLLLGYVTIPPSTTSITAGMVSDNRSFMGNQLGIWTTATRPSNVTAWITVGYNSTLGIHEVWNGSTWIPFAPDVPVPSAFLLMGA